jgi:energy-coupling factor transport system substrate-specific component
MNFERVMEIMQEVSGTQLTADVVDALQRLANKGMLKASDDMGGGSTESIDNIHKHFEEEEKNSDNKE